MSGSVEVQIAEELVPYLYMIKDGKTVNDKINLSIILGLFVSRTVTLEKAAELAGKSIWDFMDILKICGIPWGEYTDEELQLDESVLDKLAGGVYE